MKRSGVWLVGAAGNVASCVAAGWSGLKRGLLEPIGVLTEELPLSRLPLVAYDQIIFGGHEVRDCTPVETTVGLVRERILPEGFVDQVADDLAALEAEVRPGIESDASWDELVRVRDDIDSFRDRHQLERVVVLYVASTEGLLPREVPAEPEQLFAAMKSGLRVPPSVAYAAAALDLGCGFVNFTPSPGSSLAALHRLAEQRGAVHAGSDGKTGETLVKTALAPMFEIRRLLVRSWFSQNVLGNNDGVALADADRRASKLQSKDQALPAILGYQPETHVGIDYMRSFGDWKVAWDHILFRGFGGADMVMDFTWRGSDTALAAPLCIDLIRLVELALRRGESGVLSYLGLFFKHPMGSSEHRLHEQLRALLAHYEP